MVETIVGEESLNLSGVIIGVRIGSWVDELESMVGSNKDSITVGMVGVLMC